jgi:hypothetical protein
MWYLQSRYNIRQENNNIMAAVSPHFCNALHEHWRQLMSCNAYDPKIVQAHADLLRLRSNALSNTIRSYLSGWFRLTNLDIKQLSEARLYGIANQKHYWKTELVNLKAEWEKLTTALEKQENIAMSSLGYIDIYK